MLVPMCTVLVLVLSCLFFFEVAGAVCAVVQGARQKVEFDSQL